MAKNPMPPAMTSDKARQYWRATSRLMWIVLALWAVLSVGVHLFAGELNRIVVLGFPLGYFLAAQGALIGFVVLAFWHTRRQNRIDEDFNLSED